MTGNTHVAVGIATTIAVLRPKTIPECLCAITGGMIGAMISDIDSPGKRKTMDYSDDPYGWQVYTFFGLTVAFLLAIDYFAGNGAVDFVLANIGPPLFVGIVAFLGLCFYGAHTNHRSFTHSLLAGVVFVLSIWCFCRPLAFPFAIGFASHLFIDYFNRKKVQYFWPLSVRIGLNKYPSDGKLNDVLCGLGTISSVFLATFFVLNCFEESVLHARMASFFSAPVSLLGLVSVPLIIPYLIIINIATFIVYVLDYYLYMNAMGFYRGTDEHANEMEEFIHTLLLIPVIAGGMIGMMLAVFVILKGQVYKDKWRANINFYVIPFCVLISWLIVSFTFFIPDVTTWAKPLATIKVGAIPLRFIVLGYFIIINVATFLLFPRVQRFANLVIMPREKLCIVLSLLGGASGGLLAMKSTGNHQNASTLVSTLPEMMIMHAIVLTCVFYLST